MSQVYCEIMTHTSTLRCWPMFPVSILSIAVSHTLAPVFNTKHLQLVIQSRKCALEQGVAPCLVVGIHQQVMTAFQGGHRPVPRVSPATHALQSLGSGRRKNSTSCVDKFKQSGENTQGVQCQLIFR